MVWLCSGSSPDYGAIMARSGRIGGLALGGQCRVQRHALGHDPAGHFGSLRFTGLRLGSVPQLAAVLAKLGCELCCYGQGFARHGTKDNRRFAVFDLTEKIVIGRGRIMFAEEMEFPRRTASCQCDRQASESSTPHHAMAFFR